MALAPDSTVPLLTTLTEALSSTAAGFPSDAESFAPPTDGISLLNIKNDLLLSYLQNLVFLVILKLRDINGNSENSEIHDELLQKLVGLRVYLERGVRPVEGRLKYQIDQVLRAVEDANTAAKYTTLKTPAKRPANGAAIPGTNADEDSDEATDDDVSEDHNVGATNEQNNELYYRPNLKSSLARAASQRQEQQPGQQRQSSKNSTTNGTEAYRPPRITPTAMPSDPTNARQTREPRKRKSQLLDEYIDEELSSAPRAQPSIGSNNTILDRGRGGLSRTQRESERERTDYEERNFVRLPGASKAEKRKARIRDGGANRRDVFGGEDWTGLGGLGDRVTKSVVGRNGGAASVLQRREKRRATEDSPRGTGVQIGDTFEKRRKVLQGRSDRKPTKRRT